MQNSTVHHGNENEMPSDYNTESNASTPSSVYRPQMRELQCQRMTMMMITVTYYTFLLFMQLDATLIQELLCCY